MHSGKAARKPASADRLEECQAGGDRSWTNRKAKAIALFLSFWSFRKECPHSVVEREEGSRNRWLELDKQKSEGSRNLHCILERLQ